MTSLIRHFINLKFSFIFRKGRARTRWDPGGNSINPFNNDDDDDDDDDNNNNNN